MIRRNKVISALIISSCLINQPLYAFGEQEGDAIRVESTNIIEDKSVKKASIYSIYVDASKQKGTGLSQESPVNNLKDALDLISDGGRIYITGTVEIPEDFHFPNKYVTLSPTQKDLGAKIKFNKKAFLAHYVKFENMEVEFASTDKDCLFLNGAFAEFKDSKIIGRPNIFIGSEDKNLPPEVTGSLNINNETIDATEVGDIHFAGKNGHTIQTSAINLKGALITGTIDGANVVEHSTVNIDGVSTINKIQNTEKVVLYRDATFISKSGLSKVFEFYPEGIFKVDNGAKVDVEHLYGSCKLYIEVPTGEQLKEGNYIKAKTYTGGITLGDNLIQAGYKLNVIPNQNGYVLFDVLKKDSSSTNYYPVIKNLRDMIVKKGQTVDLKKGVIADDYEDGDITKNIVYPNIDTKDLPLGKNEVTYEVTDKKGNKTTMKRVIYIIANKAPVINGAEDITIKVGEVDSFDKLAGVTVYDDVDTKIVPEVAGKIEKPSGGQNKESVLIYTAKDTSGNITTKNRKINVTNQLPIITATNVSIKVGDTFDANLLGATAEDLEDGSLTQSITVKESNVDNNKPGTYKVVYTVTDSDKNTVTKDIEVTVRSNEKPVINADDKTIKAGDDFKALDSVTATDNEDKDITNKIKVKENTVNNNIPGTYKVVYEVTDNDNNTVTKEIKVTVRSNEKPVIVANNITIKAGDKFEPLKGITAVDKEDKDLTDKIKIRENTVDTAIPGKYKVIYEVVDSDNNIVTKEIKVIVRSNEKPVIKANDVTILVGDKFEELNGVTAIDKEDQDLTKEIKVIENTVDTKKPGEYKVVYEVADKDNNTVRKEIKVIVKVNENNNIDKNENSNIDKNDNIVDNNTNQNTNDKNNIIENIKKPIKDVIKTGDYKIIVSIGTAIVGLALAIWAWLKRKNR